ncbi:hypothetical protein UR08_02735 [Listeria kieliensis]|uniref:Uncharacterized protein n=1 Tax=Listeria kieliensis TaxID=1621700 RepID=A0A3D8TTV9_9LIST|nr:hypothetical protein UR08_02735 [Listeria kieliensis]
MTKAVLKLTPPFKLINPIRFIRYKNTGLQTKSQSFDLKKFKKKRLEKKTTEKNVHAPLKRMNVF